MSMLGLSLEKKKKIETCQIFQTSKLPFHGPKSVPSTNSCSKNG